MTTTQTEIYTDVRQWILSLISGAESQVVRAYNNNVPIPENAIIMTYLLEQKLDQLTQNTDEGVFYVGESIQVMMQLDAYGPLAKERLDKLTTFWKSNYTCEKLQKCQPLYATDVRDLTFVNEAGQYELRFMTSLYLQYNRAYDVPVQAFTTIPNTELNNV